MGNSNEFQKILRKNGIKGDGTDMAKALKEFKELAKSKLGVGDEPEEI